MKLIYWKNLPNFGDELNLWLWDRLLPGVFDDDASTIFVGIGTLLNELLPASESTIVFGSGAGYGRRPNIDERWRIFCVRGPLTASYLNLPAKMAITDSAILVRSVFCQSGHKSFRFGYMPHHVNARRGGKTIESICQNLGFAYIDPCLPVEQVLSVISATEVLMTEAMHGAIIADALRIPWIPIQVENIDALPFKWQDWCSSIDVSYSPKCLAVLTDIPGVPRHSLPRYVSQLKQSSLSKIFATQLVYLAKTAKPYLSKERKIHSLTDELGQRLEELKEHMRTRN